MYVGTLALFQMNRTLLTKVAINVCDGFEFFDLGNMVFES